MVHSLVGELGDVAFDSHFYVDAHAPVKGRARGVDVDVCDAGFDDLREGFAGFGVGGDADTRFGGSACFEGVFADDGGEVEHCGGFEVVEGVALAGVDVVDGSSGYLRWDRVGWGVGITGLGVD